MDKDILYEKIQKIQMIAKIDSLKAEIYSIFTILILSKDIFKTNKDLSTFLISLGIEIKPYLEKNRTGMLGKTLRFINNCNEKQIIKLKKALKKEFQKEKIQALNNNNNNYMKFIVDKYGRNKDVK
ncbi:hypothetical protein [Staphylococcus sp. DORA_6_22]|uniref:Uncharacterized protein n=1 Tax=Intestinibacter bartlettii TaxID=261299 RepID=A0A6N3CSZ2_9FIRM|nr:MAG: hypothetical protein Q614_SASC00307G0002 [Staphylococcus sp. DORA_6_22]